MNGEPSALPTGGSGWFFYNAAAGAAGNFTPEAIMASTEPYLPTQKEIEAAKMNTAVRFRWRPSTSARGLSQADTRRWIFHNPGCVYWRWPESRCR